MEDNRKEGIENHSSQLEIWIANRNPVFSICPVSIKAQKLMPNRMPCIFFLKNFCFCNHNSPNQLHNSYYSLVIKSYRCKLYFLLKEQCNNMWLLSLHWCCSKTVASNLFKSSYPMTVPSRSTQCYSWLEKVYGIMSWLLKLLFVRSC